MSELQRRITELMTAEGFKLKRSGRHRVWTDGQVTVVTCVTPSDYRALLNVKNHIRRARAKDKLRRMREERRTP